MRRALIGAAAQLRKDVVNPFVLKLLSFAQIATRKQKEAIANVSVVWSDELAIL